MNTCPICKVWEMMPYHKRWSTPMTPQEAEGALAAGWWAALRNLRDGAEGIQNPEFNGALCPRHAAIMLTFNVQYEKRREVEHQQRAQVTVAPGHEAQVQDFLAKAQALSQPPPSPEPLKPPPVIPTFGAAPPAPMPLPPVQGPVTVMTSPPPVAAIAAPVNPIVFPCPGCGQGITNGQVHACPEPEEPKDEAGVDQ
jgi:hypothetical protein